MNRMKIAVLCYVFVISLVGVSLADAAPGTFSKTELDDFTLHTFTTTEGPGDITYIFETKDGLVLFELPSIHHLSRQLKDYVVGLKKPVEAILAAYHVGGASYYPGIPIYASKAALDFIDSGEEMKVRKSIAANTPDFDLEVVRPDRLITEERLKIGGIEFLFITPTTSPIPGMNVVIPSINGYYQHVLGGGSHPLILSIEHMTKVLAELHAQKEGGFALFLDSHNGIEKPGAAVQKIAYLNELKKIRESSKDEETFVKNAQAAFPDYKGNATLSRTAKNLYADN